MELGQALQTEWLDTNGLGGFASSTVAGLNTRRYHGLLVAAMQPPAGRLVLLSKIEETLHLDGRAHELSANRYPGVVHPQGHLFLSSFRSEPVPTFIYQIEEIELHKRVYLIQGQNTVVVEYDLRVSDFARMPECRLELRPLIAFRDYHATTHENGALDGTLDVQPGLLSIEPYSGLPRLYFAYRDARMEPRHVWYRNVEYDRERERGLDYREDLYCPFSLAYSLSVRPVAVLTASTAPEHAAQTRYSSTAELRRREVVPSPGPVRHPLIERLARAADRFIVRRGDSHTVIAGYHWFTDWGRDTMMALPGLTLVTGNFDIARDILKTFAAHLDRGMLPNRFPDTGESPEYNTVDATLWFFEAIRSYVQYTGDLAFVRQHLYDALKDVIEWHLRGTRYCIQVDADGLLNAGEPGVQLTWMDARVGEQVITPRHGKPVEIQALWFNALRILEDFARRFEDTTAAVFLTGLAQRAEHRFNELFWNPKLNCLYDVVNGDSVDDSIRPNQILALSLHHAILDASRHQAVLEIVERELLTPMGLRTLSPRDPRYRPHYEGDVSSRDSAYHQGTVWPWLMGPFISAYVKSGGPAAREQAARWLGAFASHLNTAGLGYVSEIADAEPPFTPRGCIAQAWSVAELLRAAVEDVFVAKNMGISTAAA
jgi:predicted glycogen debranching enzyme